MISLVSWCRRRTLPSVLLRLLSTRSTSWDASSAAAISSLAMVKGAWRVVLKGSVTMALERCAAVILLERQPTVGLSYECVPYRVQVCRPLLAEKGQYERRRKRPGQPGPESPQRPPTCLYISSICVTRSRAVSGCAQAPAPLRNKDSASFCGLAGPWLLLPATQCRADSWDPKRGSISGYGCGTYMYSTK